MITNGQNYNEAFPSPIASPTGTVTISGFPSGVPTSGTLTAAIVPGFQAQEGVTTITAPANVATGNYTVTVSYSGDANYMATSEQFPVSIIGVSGGQSSTTTATMSGSISPSSTITITGMVTGQSGQGAPTGGIIVYSSGGDITEINVNPGSGTTSSFSLTLSSQFLYQGANFITLQYTGDNTYYPSAYQLANPVLSPLSDFSIIPQTTIVPVTLGHSNTDTINLYSMNGFSGAVSFTCAGTTVTCSVPSSETLSAGGTIPLTLTINAGSSVVPGSYNVLVTGKDSTGKYVHTVQVQALIASSGLQFIPVTPCRVADTRWPTGPFGGPEMAAGTSRSFDIPQSACGIPSTAVAYSLNVTVVPDGFLSYLTLWPTGETQPYVSTLNSDGRVKANAAITPAGTNGGVSVFVSNATNVILDIDGYFVPAGTASALAFYPLTPCRVADTRNATGPLGGPSISGGSSRSFPVQSSSCGIPATAKAYSLNVTAVPHTTLGYLTAWATGETQPYVSTLNSSTGAVTANAAMVPAGTSGEVSIFVSDDCGRDSGRERLLRASGDRRIVTLPGHALPGDRHAQRCGSLQRSAGRGRRGKLVRAAIDRTGICAERDGRASGLVGLPDPVAGRRSATLCLDVECSGRSHHLEHGHRADNQRKHRCLLLQPHQPHPRPLQLLRPIRRSSWGRELNEDKNPEFPWARSASSIRLERIARPAQLAPHRKRAWDSMDR